MSSPSPLPRSPARRTGARSPARPPPPLTAKSSFASLHLKPRSLRHQPSKLDLIDDTTLTSLPFPPPPAKRARHTASRASLRTPPASAKSPAAVPADLVDASRVDADTSMCTEGDDTFDESQDPIVLVEDYVPEVVSGPPSQAMLWRQKSLAHMKSRLRGGVSRSSSASGGAPSPAARAAPENLEDIFGRLPGSDQLKHCTLCNKPLYEISSVITTASSRPSSGSGPDARASSRNCDEFVCWDCITVYEQIVNDLDGGQLEFAGESQPNSPRKLLGQRSPSQTHVEIEPKKRKSFSAGLISRFHELHQRGMEPAPSEAQTRTPQWLLNLQERLRWS